MSMSPENYRNLERDSKQLIKQAEMFMESRTIENHIIPMLCTWDEISLCNELSAQHQKCVDAARNAKIKDIKEKYFSLAEQLYLCRERIMVTYGFNA